MARNPVNPKAFGDDYFARAGIEPPYGGPGSRVPIGGRRPSGRGVLFSLSRCRIPSNTRNFFIESGEDTGFRQRLGVVSGRCAFSLFRAVCFDTSAL